MLTYLRIRNLAVVDDVVLEPGPGLTVLTGETGAGKSIIFDGLSLVLGERASLDAIRRGADRAEVEAVFRCDRDPQLPALLSERDLQGDEPGTLLVRRVITPSGSRAYLNDHPVSLKLMKQIGDRLVDLHGQHAHQSLLRTGAHRELLDRFAEHGAMRERVARTWERAVEAGERLEKMRMDERDRAQRVDLLRFQVQEIEAAGLTSGEDEELAAERRRLAHAEELAECGAEASALLYEAEESAVALVARASRRLQRLLELDPDAPVELDELQRARVSLEEAARSLQVYLDDLEVDARRLEEVESRLAALDGLRRKYGDTLGAVLEHARRARQELEGLERLEESLEALEAELADSREAYEEAADELSRSRRMAVDELREQVTGELGELAMPSARFEVVVERRRGDSPPGLPDGAARHGLDSVEFRLAANPGEDGGPLSKIASGGELSRVMLALKLSATEGDPLETLIFDEVDAGIGGGRVAEHLARRLATLARTHQVLVVTHLPQVAAYADEHVGVRKVELDERVRVEVHELVEGEQIDELARMLGGLEITEATRRHAREMLAARD